jgi:hypothetical protein
MQCGSAAAQHPHMHGSHKVRPFLMLVWSVGSRHLRQQLGRDAVVCKAGVEHALGKSLEVSETHRLRKSVF